MINRTSFRLKGISHQPCNEEPADKGDDDGEQTLEEQTLDKPK